MHTSTIHQNTANLRTYEHYVRPAITDTMPSTGLRQEDYLNSNNIMAKQRTAHAYELELRKMIKSRTGADMEPWLLPQVRATASNMVMLDKVQAELEATDSLVTLVSGSMAQMKNEVSPLLPYYDKMQRTLMLQFEAIGLNYKTTPSKVKEDTKKGVDTEKYGLSNLLTQARDTMNEVPEMD